jgi:16S rRNA (cytosine967-C5)-methyltransferase
MSRYHSYLSSAIQILNLYKREKPFASFLKKYFAANKKFGSKDRKQISHLCYCYFRLGKSLPDTPVEERILVGLFLCSTEPNEILEQLKHKWNEKIYLTTDKKLLIIKYSLLIKDIFPWKDELSEEIEYEKFCESFLVQPNLFIRLRPGNEQIARQKLQHAEINFNAISNTCLALANSSKIENIIELDKEVVVQDYSSQQTGEIFKNLKLQKSNFKLSVWDCCAGSGGKSLLIYDINPNIDLTVSDRRESIIANLEKRFAKAGITNYESFIADLTTSNPELQTSNFELILCDVPCTGSGTWSRTPEQLYYFDKSKIEEYASVQKKIVLNIIPYLQPGGYLLYITCSVFERENEDAVDYIKQQFNLDLVKMELLRGYDKKADTMFVALMKKIL